MNSVQKEMIKLYAKQLKVPTFNHYEKVIRQLSIDDGYEQFLIELMKQEVAERSVTGQKCRIKAAKFPSLKTLDEFDMSRLENVSESTIRQLASCDFIKQRQNIVMIGNPGSGKTHLSIALGMNACEAGFRFVHVRRRLYLGAGGSGILSVHCLCHRFSLLTQSRARGPSWTHNCTSASAPVRPANGKDPRRWYNRSRRKRRH